jgi:hypothetical protein
MEPLGLPRTSVLAHVFAAAVVAGVPGPSGADAQPNSGADLIWTALPVTDDASQSFRGASAVVVGSSVYVVGGSASTRLYRFDPATNVWTRLPDAPFGLIDGGAAAVSGRMFVFGGAAAARVQIYDPALQTWSLGASIPAPTSGFSVGEAVGKIYKFGGGGTATVHEYDPALDSWRQRPDMPTARDRSAAVFIHNHMYVLGGELNGAVDAVEAWEPFSGVWAVPVGASLPTRRRQLAAVAIEGESSIYVIGGLDDLDRSVATVDELDTSHGDGHQFAGRHHQYFTRRTLHHPRHGAAVVLFDGRLYVIGGATQSAAGSQAVHVVESGSRISDTGPPFTDDPLQSGQTAVKSVHVTELRSAIDALRTARGLPVFSWTDPLLHAGMTPVKAIHVAELWAALQPAYVAAGHTPPMETVVTARTTPITAAQLVRLRTAVVALRTHSH